MSLDLNKVAAQVGEMIGRMRTSLADQQSRLRGALDTLHRGSTDSAALKTKIDHSKTTWLVAGPEDILDKRYLPPSLPSDFTVLATDGSHIETDRHRAARCYLLNISHVVLRYGAHADAVLESVPRLYAEDKDLVISPPNGRGREQLIDSTLLGAKRSVEEFRQVADLGARLPDGSSAIALLDGTLMLWGLEAYPDFVTHALLDEGLLTELDRIKRAGKNKRLALASYISAPRSTDVVNLLRVAVCPHEPVDCDKNCGGKRDCDMMAGLVDAQLFFSLLAPGERSAIFSSRSKVSLEHYGEHKVHFFYVRIEDEIARVEIPEWVALDTELVDLTYSLVLDQCRRGQGYPVALSEAHEQAVVTGPDRENFWQLVEAGLIEEHLPAPTTGKSRSKRTRWV